MPIYEYHCQDCRKRVSVFQRSVSSTNAPRCPECGGGALNRLISSFAFHRGMPDFDDGSPYDEAGMMDGVDQDDPESVARWARSMGDQMGGDLPPDFDNDLARMAAGGAPDGDLGGDDFGGWDE